MYLGSGDVLTYDPVLADLERVERKLLALWEAIRLATETGELAAAAHEAVRLVRPPGSFRSSAALPRLIRCR
ncbi:hypothetical protein SVIOM74S_03779 [Streptomyces violarus]